MVDRSGLQNLNINDKIVEADGTATQFFMRLLQGKNDLTDDVQTQVDNLRSINIETDAPISGGPYPFADHEDGDPPLTISHDDSGVTAGVYGDATHVPQFTVDDKGHITDVTEVPIAGGGGGNWWFHPPAASGFALTTTGTGNLNLTDDADAGLLFIDPSNTADTRRAAYKTLTTPTGDFDFQVLIQSFMTSQDFQGIGLWAQNSSTGREYWWGFHSNIPMGLFRTTNLSFNSTAYSSTPRAMSDLFLRMVKIGANFFFYYSGNGKQWQLAFTEAVSAWTSNVDRVGLFTRCSYATTSPGGVGAACPYFSLTGTAV